MAKKPAAKSDRNDPNKNKSLAIRNVLADMPKAKASEVALAVKKKYGHDVHQNMIYMMKTRVSVRRASQAPGRSKGTTMKTPMTSAAHWVEAIHIARELLEATGSVANATALLEAVGS